MERCDENDDAICCCCCAADTRAVDKLHISTIFARYMDLDARVRPLIFAVRQWSKARAINDAFQGAPLRVMCVRV